MDLAIQIIANDKKVRKDTVQDIKDFNSQSQSTQVKKGEELVSMLPAFKKLSIYQLMILLKYLQKLML